MIFLEPWCSLSTANAPVFERQLRSELLRDHALFNISVTAIARREDRDDVLYAIDDGSGRVAQVQLTYSSPKDSQWPITLFYDSLSAWVDERMNIDHAKFIAFE